MKLRLAPLGVSDREPFLAATRESRRFHRPWVRPPTSSAEFSAFVEGIGPSRERLLLWGTDAAGDEVVAGYFSLGEIVRGQLNSAYLGYWASHGWAGRGAMSAGMRMLLRHAFRSVRLHRVEANIQPENLASIALARRAGFRREGLSPRYLKIGGRWRDHERWAVTVEDWRRGS
ncbi:MAG: GNAT family protein [Myxococcota bacterium]|nr:GNAT family protein [Myxococcota bacterium]